MAKNELGEIRRSAAAATFGPGAVVDFRAGEATISAVAAGLEEWDSNFRPAGMLNDQSIREERLQKKLKKKGFRIPPVRDPAKDTDANKALVAVRFPAWLQCPQCNRVGRQDMWHDEPGKAGRSCPQCTQKQPGKRPVYVIPVRFVMACEAGHLDEFPWHFWVGHREGCTNKEFLKLESVEAGLAGLILSCPKCSASRSMDRIFSKETWDRFSNCRGHRPWLTDSDETCTCKPRALQRGASNLYFPVVESALSIPPWSDRLQEALGMYWDAIINVPDPAQRVQFIEVMAGGPLAPVMKELDMTPKQVADEVQKRLSAETVINTDNLRIEEYRQFTGGTYVQGLDREFEIRPQQIPSALKPWFSRLVKVTRLREVRAMTGFTRIQPPGDGQTNVAQLSATPLEWLPAIEVRGEGVFLEFDQAALEKWEKRSGPSSRATRINDRWETEWKERHGGKAAPPRKITPRFLLVHTFAHALMRQLTLDCGYSSTALRERLYVESDPSVSMAGVLIYTATTDDDGTLGGLQRQGDPKLISRTVQAAIHAQAWCSSDPLCIEDMMAPDDGLSLAACHSCVLSPETSCEEFNRFLDRAMLVGTPLDHGTGFFHSLTEGAS